MKRRTPETVLEAMRCRWVVLYLQASNIAAKRGYDSGLQRLQLPVRVKV